MIRNNQSLKSNAKTVFKEHDLAHKYLDGLTGVEIGAAAHNPFGLAGSINLAQEEDYEFYKKAQIEMCGTYAEVDVWGTAENTGLEDNSQDYVISSHVVEHFPNPIRVFEEWNRILKPGGIIFMILPKRDALPFDRNRSVTDVINIIDAYEVGYTVDNWQGDVPVDRHGHYYVYTPSSMQVLIAEAGLNWEILEVEETDSKVGNGFTIVARYNPTPLQQEETPVEEVEAWEEAEAEPSTEEPAKSEFVVVELPKKSRKKK